MERCDFYEWEYLYFEKVWVYVNLYTEQIIAIVKIKYPFNEGDDYWTIDNGEVTRSCWDFVSEELHELNPNKIYFATEKLANNYLKQLN